MSDIFSPIPCKLTDHPHDMVCGMVWSVKLARSYHVMDRQLARNWGERRKALGIHSFCCRSVQDIPAAHDAGWKRAESGDEVRQIRYDGAAFKSVFSATVTSAIRIASGAHVASSKTCAQ
jgi:hypothetical protein